MRPKPGDPFSNCERWNHCAFADAAVRGGSIRIGSTRAMNAFRRSMVRIWVAALAIGYCPAQIDGNAAYQAFLKWRETAENAGLGWDATLNKYGSQLRASSQ